MYSKNEILQKSILNIADQFDISTLQLTKILEVKDILQIVDGSKEEQIEESLEAIIEETEHYYHGAAHYWLLAGETCPVMGLIGAVLGLILALQKLDNPKEMAEGIAGAFTATVTGIAGAYMFLGPWGNKLKNKAFISS